MAAVGVGVVVVATTHEVAQFPGVHGPLEPSAVAPPQPTSWRRYADGSTSRLAVLLTDEQSSWLGLVHALKAFGIPFRITTSTQEALRHRVVLVYPRISGKVLSQEDLRALASFPRNGGTLIGANVLGGGLNEVFGFMQATPSRRRFTLRLASADSPLLAQFIDPREQTLSLGDRSRNSETIGTLGYSETKEQPLAVYDDGSAAITQRSYAKGRAYAFGFDVGDFIFRAHHNRHHGASRSYVNSFEPSADVIARLIRTIYRQGNPDAATLGTVPEGRALSVVFSYDIDARDSFPNMLAYARFLRDAGIRGTFYIQTKYVGDFNDDILFDMETAGYVRELVGLGMDIGSHTVSHSDSFSDFPLGSGEESYPDYRPIVISRRATRSGTILGELRVSKYLLETLGQAGPVVSFRPGYLDYPEALPQALTTTGYRYSSSMTANKALTHLPFRLNYARRAGQETEVYEFPVTIEDEKPPEMGSRVGAAVALARQIARYGGSFVILTHPTVLGHKLAFHEAFHSAVEDWAWFGSQSELGAWWAARDAVQVDSRCDEAGCAIELYAPHRIAGLSLTLPRGCRARADGGDDDAPFTVRQSGVVLASVEGQARLHCTRLRQSSAHPLTEAGPETPALQ